MIGVDGTGDLQRLLAATAARNVRPAMDCSIGGPPAGGPSEIARTVTSALAGSRAFEREQRRDAGALLLELRSVAFIFSREKSSIGSPWTIVYAPVRRDREPYITSCGMS